MQVIHWLHTQDGTQLAELGGQPVIGLAIEIIITGMNDPLARKGMPVPTAIQLFRLQRRSADNQQKSLNERLQWKAPARWRVHDYLQHSHLQHNRWHQGSG